MNNTSNKENNKNKDFHYSDWKRWADRYFPVEEKINNWEDDLRWVLKDK